MSALDTVKNLQDNACIVDVLLKEALASECNDCGKCVLGYEGVSQMAMILRDITERKGRTSDPALLGELCAVMNTQSLCEKGEEIAQAVQYGLEHYGEDFEGHISKKTCRAGVCAKFMTYHILPDVCTGCNECVDVCEDDAILGKKRFIHVIDLNECTQCGACLDACDEGAIVRAGAVKPKGPKKPVPCKR